MGPRVDLAARKAMKAAAGARAVERKKKRLASQFGQYELKLLKKGSRADPDRDATAQVEVETALVTPRTLLLEVPLV